MRFFIHFNDSKSIDGMLQSKSYSGVLKIQKCVNAPAVIHQVRKSAVNAALVVLKISSRTNGRLQWQQDFLW
jgi:hypothetical protein